MAAGIKIVGAVGIRVRPVVKGFKDEVEDELGKLDGKKVHVDVKAEVEVDDKAAKKAMQGAADDIAEKGKLKFKVDYDGLDNALRKVRQKLHKVTTKTKSIKLGVDADGLDKNIVDLKKRVEKSWVKMNVSWDERGYQQVLDKINEIRHQKIVQAVKFKADDASLDEAQRKYEKALAKAQSKKTIDLFIDPGRGGLEKALAAIDAELEKFRAVDMVVELNKPALTRARNQLQRELDREPYMFDVDFDSNESLESVKRELESLRSSMKTVKLPVEADAQGVQDALDDINALLAEHAEKLREPEVITISYNADWDSLNDALRDVRRKMREVEAIEMPVEVSMEGLIEAEEKLLALRDHAKVEMEITDDAAGYKKVLDKVKELRALATLQKIEFEADEESLRRTEAEFQGLLDGLTEPRTVQITLGHGVGRSSLLRQIAMIEDELAKLDTVEIPVELDRTSLETARALLNDELTRTPYEIDVDWSNLSSLKAAKAKMEAELSQMRSVKVPVDASEEGIRKFLHDIDKAINEAESKTAGINVNARTAAASAQMRAVSRDRTANIFVRVNQRSLAIAEGILQSLAGTNTLRWLGRGLERAATNFDRMTLKIATVASVLGGVADTMSYIVASAFSIGEGMLQSVGLLATLPAMLYAAATGFLVYRMAFNNFSQAFSDIPVVAETALEKLPPLARKAVEELRGEWKKLNDPVQEAFWAEMGSSLQDFTKKILPEVRQGLTKTAPHVGKFTAAMLDSFTQLADSGQMDVLFTNLSGFFDNLTAAGKPLFDAINILGVRGSQYLPQLATWLAEGAQSFHDWIDAADKAGDINRWIEQGVQSFKDMWSVIMSTVDVARALTRVFNAAGMTGLTGFRDTMRDIADTMLSPEWQTAWSTVFRGALEGASLLNVGVRALGTSMQNNAGYAGDMLRILGELGGKIVGVFALAVGNKTFQGGTLAAVQGLIDGLDILSGGFNGLFTMIGDFGYVAGDVFRNIAPIVSGMFITLRKVMEVLGPAASSLSELLGASLGRLSSGMLGPLTLVADVIAGMVGMLKGMDPVLRNLLLTMAALSVLNFKGMGKKGADGTRLTLFKQLNEGAGQAIGKYRAFAKEVQIQARAAHVASLRHGEAVRASAAAVVPLQTRLIGLGRAAEQGVVGVAGAFGRISHAGDGAVRGLTAVGARLPGIMQGSMLKVITKVDEAGRVLDRRMQAFAPRVAAGLIATNVHMQSAITGINTQFARLRPDVGLRAMRAFGTGLQAALGTALIYARTSIGNLLSLFGGGWGIAIGAAMLAISALGEANQKTAQQVDTLTEALVAQDEAAARRAVTENLKDQFKKVQGLGVDFKKVVDMILNGDAEKAAQMIERLVPKQLQRDSGAGIIDSDIWGKNKELVDLAKDIRGQGNIFNEAQIGAEIFKSTMSETNEVISVTNAEASKLGEAMAILGDNSADASSQVRALKDALDILNGKAPNADQAIQGLAETIRSIPQKFQKEVNGKKVWIDLSKIVTMKGPNKGQIAATAAGKDLAETLSSAMDDALVVAMKMKKDGVDPAAIETYLNDVQADLAAKLKGTGIELPEIELAIERLTGGSNQEIAFLLSMDLTEFDEASIKAAMTMDQFNGMKAVATLGGKNEELGTKLALSYDSLEEWRNTVAEATAGLKTEEAEAERQRLMAGLIELAASDPTVLATIDPRIFNSEEARLVAKIAELKKKSPITTEAKAEIKQAEDALALIRQLLASIDGKKTSSEHSHTNITTNVTRTARQTLGEMPAGWNPRTVMPVANGGILDGKGVMQFAKGGMYRPRSFGAGGMIPRIPGTPRGFERHVAQIARPGVMPRVWAEKETQGEAYVPLAASKRPRSLQILGQTASMFGYSLVRNADGAPGPYARVNNLGGHRTSHGTSYANGGITVPAPVVVPGGGGGPTFNINNHYPVAEPTSVTINRALQLAASPGLGME